MGLRAYSVLLARESLHQAALKRVSYGAGMRWTKMQPDMMSCPLVNANPELSRRHQRQIWNYGPSPGQRWPGLPTGETARSSFLRYGEDESADTDRRR